MRLIFYLSKAIFLIFIIYIIHLEINELGSLYKSINIVFLLLFYISSMILILISFLACFDVRSRPYDLSIIFPELPPLKQGIFTNSKFKRFMLILENIASIAIYTFILYYVIEPSVKKIIYIAYSFIPLVCYCLISAFTPEKVKHDLSKVFPELLA